MGTSFVEYSGFGFWTRDSFLQSWLRTMLEEMEKSPSPEPWQEAMKEHWRTQEQIDAGCMSLGLDEFLIDAARCDAVLSQSRAALERSDPVARRTGELFIDLLAGKLKTNESSAINYL